MNKSLFLSAVTLACLWPCATLPAQSSRTATATAETQEYSSDGGSRRTVGLEYKFVNDDTTLVGSPVIGERRTPGMKETAVGAGMAIYHNWSSVISTRTSVFVSREAPVFAKHNFAQDVTVKVADRTAVTLGGRLARYMGNRDVSFLSASVRQYFPFGSVAFQLRYVNPEAGNAPLTYVANVSVRDASGDGRTQLWVSVGEASLANEQLSNTFSGHEYGAVVQRVQPITDTVSLIPLIGYTSTDRPIGRIGAVKIGLGLALKLD